MARRTVRFDGMDVVNTSPLDALPLTLSSPVFGTPSNVAGSPFNVAASPCFSDATLVSDQPSPLAIATKGLESPVNYPSLLSPSFAHTGFPLLPELDEVLRVPGVNQVRPFRLDLMRDPSLKGQAFVPRPSQTVMDRPALTPSLGAIDFCIKIPFHAKLVSFEIRSPAGSALTVGYLLSEICSITQSPVPQGFLDNLDAKARSVVKVMVSRRCERMKMKKEKLKALLQAEVLWLDFLEGKCMFQGLSFDPLSDGKALILHVEEP